MSRGCYTGACLRVSWPERSLVIAANDAFRTFAPPAIGHDEGELPLGPNGGPDRHEERWLW
jgi:hypothetical protein